MGDVHALEGDAAGGRCVVVNRYTGERTPVAVDPDKIDILDLPAIPGACPLFRRDAGGLGVCPVHETWPPICAEYACWRILVLDRAGRRAARVMGTRHIAVDDPALEPLLERHRSRLALAVDDAAWDTALVDLVEGAGYRVVR